MPRNTDGTQLGQGDSKTTNFTAHRESETSLQGLRRVYKEDNTSYSTCCFLPACTIWKLTNIMLHLIFPYMIFVMQYLNFIWIPMKACETYQCKWRDQTAFKWCKTNQWINVFYLCPSECLLGFLYNNKTYSVSMKLYLHSLREEGFFG